MFNDLSKMLLCISTIFSIVYFLCNILYKYHTKNVLSHEYAIPIEYFDADILYKVIKVFVDLIVVMLPVLLIYFMVYYSIYAIKKKYSLFLRIYYVLFASVLVYSIFVYYYWLPWSMKVGIDSHWINIFIFIPFVLSIINVVAEIFFEHIIALVLLLVNIGIVYLITLVLLFNHTFNSKEIYGYEIASNEGKKYIVASHYQDKLVLLNYSYSYIEKNLIYIKGSIL